MSTTKRRRGGGRRAAGVCLLAVLGASSSWGCSDAEPAEPDEAMGGNLPDPPTGGTHGCLAAGTRVATAFGPRPIEELRVGDRVLSYDERTGQVRENPVTATRSLRKQVGTFVLPGGERLRVTAEHPLFDAASGTYRRAEDWSPASRLLFLGTGWDAVASRELWPEPSEVAAPDYDGPTQESLVVDLEVASDHNFFAEGALVHNKTGGAPPVTICNDRREDEIFVCSGDVDVYREGEVLIVRARGPGGLGGEGGQGGAPESDPSIATRLPWNELGETSPSEDEIILHFQLCSLAMLGASIFGEPGSELASVAGAGQLCSADSARFGQLVGDGIGWLGRAGSDFILRLPADFGCLAIGRGLERCVP